MHPPAPTMDTGGGLPPLREIDAPPIIPHAPAPVKRFLWGLWSASRGVKGMRGRAQCAGACGGSQGGEKNMRPTAPFRALCAAKW